MYRDETPHALSTPTRAQAPPWVRPEQALVWREVRGLLPRVARRVMLERVWLSWDLLVLVLQALKRV